MAFPSPEPNQWHPHARWPAPFLCPGAKRWTIFHPDDAWCLYPNWPTDAPRLEPTFPNLDEMEAEPDRFPLLALARRVDVTLRAGEVLLVPGGAPHRVRNGSDDEDADVSIALAANFVDASNHAAAAFDLGLMARREAAAEHEDRGAGAAVTGLGEMDSEALAADDRCKAEAMGVPSEVGRIVPYSEYAKGNGAEAERREMCEWLVDEAAAAGGTDQRAGPPAAAEGGGAEPENGHGGGECSSDDDEVPQFEEEGWTL